MVKLGKKKKSQGRGPSSSLGIMSFNDPRKSLIKFSPELVVVSGLVFGVFVLVLQFF